MAMDWKVEQQRLKKAAEFGEQIARGVGFTDPPINPFTVIKKEGGRIRAFGDDFGDDFDGRLEYQRPAFLLFYNTKYNAWSHTGTHHPKVTFTVGHELGHCFLQHHRDYLMGGGGAHGSLTEFQSNRVVEREADSFSSGLLMPEYLLRPRVNSYPPNLDAVKKARDAFQVSLTSMLVRWVQLCDFPCAVASVREGTTEWGFCSPGMKQARAYRITRGVSVSSRSAQEFVQDDPSFGCYREGEGYSAVSNWVANDDLKFLVSEHFLTIPSTRQMLVFLTADENDVFGD